ncbi:hypothetical protein [Embleya sp. NBC_00896]|uniref:hypothetical protein n=1 Tax=Embleya sp. NBC_00896 TaxID=2975961 RepID=UPI002F916705|nr:hypothetical protein OG928_48465 [Embleya sp. NBC_00896]
MTTTHDLDLDAFAGHTARHDVRTGDVARELADVYAATLAHLAGPDAHVLAVPYEPVPDVDPDPVLDPHLYVVDAFGRPLLRLRDGEIPAVTDPRLRAYWGDFDLARRACHEEILDRLRRMGGVFPRFDPRVPDVRVGLPISATAVTAAGGARLLSRQGAPCLDTFEAADDMFRTATDTLMRRIADTITEALPEAAYLLLAVFDDHDYSHEDTYPKRVLDERGETLLDFDLKHEQVDLSGLSDRTRAAWGRRTALDFGTLRHTLQWLHSRLVVFDELPSDLRKAEYDDKWYCVALRPDVRVEIGDPHADHHRLAYEPVVRPYRPRAA